MIRFIESIKLIDGEAQLMHYHAERVERTVGRRLCLPFLEKKKKIQGIAKHRVVYTKSGVIVEVETLPYFRKTINRLQVIEDDTIDYALKYENRKAIQSLFQQRGEADDILIIKKGKVTDTSYCNLVFKNKTGLFTPAQPLLKGVKRQFLLDQGMIQERDILKADIEQYDSVYLINAMIELGEIEIPIDQIIF